MEETKIKVGSIVADNEFHTKDLGLATSLMAENVKYLRTEKDAENSRRLIFVFEKDENIDRVQKERANGTHIVSSTHYEECSRRLKSIIHSI